MGTVSTSDFRKGLKVQIDGTPYLMVEMNFRKPGKGTALYECKMKNLLRNTVVDRTYRAGQVLEEADVMEFTAQYLYKQGDSFVFMNNQDYEQYELTADQVGDAAKYLKENMDCQLMTFNGNAISVFAPNPRRPASRVRRAGAERKHRHGRAKARQARDRRRDPRPVVHQHGRLATRRYADGRVHRTDQRSRVSGAPE